MLARLAEKGEDRQRIVGMLLGHRRKVDRTAIQPRRRTRLQPAHRQLQFAQPRRQRQRRRVAHAPASEVCQADMDQPVEEGPGRQHHRTRRKTDAQLGDHTGDPPVLEQQVVAGLGEDRQILLLLQPAADRLPIEHAIRLRACRADRRALAGIEDAKLDPGLVGRRRHRPAKRVDLLHEMPLADAANRRIAAHRTERLEVVRQQQGFHPHARRSKRRLGAGMAATNDDDVETVGK
ncbi:MAG: hypothetical protein AW07_03696 [Candidatus Accumulibacter sp. SK-11]|nr:MAG: hypothetical protein AW07_03696 [Candidatus Accumulibacter sp. SK-11]